MCCRFLGRAYKPQHAANALFGCKLEQYKQVEPVAWHCCRFTSNSFRVLVMLVMILKMMMRRRRMVMMMMIMMMRRRRMVMVMMKMKFCLQWTPLLCLCCLGRDWRGDRGRGDRGQGGGGGGSCMHLPPCTHYIKLSCFLGRKGALWRWCFCMARVWTKSFRISPKVFQQVFPWTVLQQYSCERCIARSGFAFQTDQPNMQVFQLFRQSKIPNSSCQSWASFVLYIVFLDRQVMRLLPPGPPDVAIIHNPVDEHMQFVCLSIVMDRIAGGDGRGPPSDPAACKALQWPFVLQCVGW